MNHMNGNQALGYARIRYVQKDGQYGDFAKNTSPSYRNVGNLQKADGQIGTGADRYGAKADAAGENQY